MRRCLRDPTFSCFDTIPECDRHTHTHRQTDRHRHTTTANTALSIASRGKNHTHNTPKTLSYGVKIAKIVHGLYFDYNTKLVAMTTSLEESEKLDGIDNIHTNTFHLVKKL